jgi:WD40 repeat protein
LATLPKTRHVAFSSNGTELLLGIGKELVVWDVETWTQSRAIVLENNLYSGLFGFAYSPDGEIIAHLSNEGAYLANANTGELVKQWQGLDVEYTAEDSQFTPDGEWLVVQYNDLYEKGLLFLPVYKDTEFIKVELSDRYSIRDFAISADGRYLGVSDGRGTAIYDLPKLLENTE